MRRLLIFLGTAALLGAQTPEVTPTRGIVPYGSYSFSDLETVNSVNGNLLFRLPLAAFPKGRGGQQAGVTLTYNSAFYDLSPYVVSDSNGTYLKSELSPQENGGWQYGYEYGLDLVVKGVPNGSVCSDPGTWKVFRLSALFPDGSSHVLHPLGYSDNGGDGYYEINPGGYSPSCGTSTNAPITYHTSDGTFVKVTLPGGNPAWGGQQWTMSFPDGMTVTGNGASTSAIVDRNGNMITVTHQAIPGIDPTHILHDSAGREIVITNKVGANGLRQDEIRQTGANGSTLTWLVNFGSVSISSGLLQYTCSDSPSLYCLPNYSITTVTSVVLPDVGAGSLQYAFGYSGNAVPGWGQMNHVTMPAGASVDYVWAGDNHFLTVPLENPVASKTVKWCDEWDAATPALSCTAPCGGQIHCETSSWTWNFPSSSTFTGPDGGATITTFNNPRVLSDPQRGLVTSVANPDGSSVARHWLRNLPYGAGASDPGNPYVDIETRTTAGPNAVSSVTTFAYDKNGNLRDKVEKDWNGATLRTTSQRIVSGPGYATTAPAQGDTAAYWNAAAPNLRALVTCRSVTGALNGAVSEYTYDGGGHGLVTQERRWDSTRNSSQPACGTSAVLNAANSVATAYGYDGNGYGNLQDVTDGNGFIRHIGYDATGAYPSSVTEAYGTGLARPSYFTYDPNAGVVTSETDYNGLTRQHIRDSLGRELQLRESGSLGLLRLTTTTYQDANRRVIVRTDNVNPNDQQLGYITLFDQLGRVRLRRQLVNAADDVNNDTLGIKVQTRYGYSGRAAWQMVSNPYSSATSAASGESSSGWTVTASDWGTKGSSVTVVAGSTAPSPPSSVACPMVAGSAGSCYGGNSVTSVDEAQRGTTNTIDALGRMGSVSQTGTNTATSYTWDVLGNLRAVGQQAYSGGPVISRSFTYDSLSRLLAASNPESGFLCYGLIIGGICKGFNGSAAVGYDGNGNLLNRTDARGVVTSFGYDQLNRPTTKSYSGTPGAPAVTYGYVGTTDFLASVSSSAATYAYSGHDAFGRPGSGTQTVGGQPWMFPAVIWTPGGKIGALTYPSGRTVSSSFDNMGRVTGVTGVLSGSPTQYVASAAPNAPVYAPHGGLKQVTYGDGVTRTFGYNARLETSSISAGSLLSLGMNWNANGTLGSQTINRNSPQFAATQSYSYDNANRLTQASESGNWSQWYSFDDVGNRAVVSNGSGQNSYFPSSIVAAPQVATWNNPQDVASQYPSNRWNGVAHDAAGNVTGVGTQTLGYDAESRMVSWTGSGGTASFTYDGDGRRVTKTAGGVTTTYVYDPAGRLALEVGGPAPAGSGTSYLTTDHLGSTRLVTNAAGGCVGAHDYLPFGEEIESPRGRGSVSCYGAVDTDRKYTGKERDAETGLDYFGARYFSGAQGRFTSPDQPFADQHIEDPQSWNMYAYVRNNPLAHVDPNGKACSALNNSSGFCQRADLYTNLDMLVGSKTRFFAAASSASQELADVAVPGFGAMAASPGTRAFLESTGQALERVNLESAGQILSGQMTGSAEALDRSMVHREQTAVQKQLDQLKGANSEGYGTAVKEINTLLNGTGAKTQGLVLGGNLLFSTDKAYSTFLGGVRKSLGHNIDFANQKDREAIGNGLVQHIRDGGCDVTRDKVSCR